MRLMLSSSPQSFSPRTFSPSLITPYPHSLGKEHTQRTVYLAEDQGSASALNAKQIKKEPTGSKFAVVMLWVGCRHLQLLKAPHVILEVLVVLRVDGVHLTVRHVLVKQRAHEEG